MSYTNQQCLQILLQEKFPDQFKDDMIDESSPCTLQDSETSSRHNFKNYKMMEHRDNMMKQDNEEYERQVSLSPNRTPSLWPQLLPKVSDPATKKSAKAEISEALKWK